MLKRDVLPFFAGSRVATFGQDVKKIGAGRCASSVIRTLLELMEPGEDVSILRRPWPPQSRKPGRNIEDIPSHLWYALVENPFCSWTSL